MTSDYFTAGRHFGAAFQVQYKCSLLLPEVLRALWGVVLNFQTNFGGAGDTVSISCFSPIEQCDAQCARAVRAHPGYRSNGEAVDWTGG